MAELVIGIDTSEKLPDGYTRLEYVATGDTAATIVISDVKFSASNNIKQEVRIYYDFKSTDQRYMMTGFGNAQYSCIYVDHRLTGECNFITNSIDINSYKFTTPKLLDVTFTVYDYSYTHKGVLVVKDNGETVLNETQTGSYAFDNSNLGIFANGNNGNPLTNSRIYYYKVYKDGSLSFNGIPAKNANNAVGFYDLVSGKFYTKTGGHGSLIAGPAVLPETQEVIPVIYLGTSDLPHSNKKYDLYDRVYDDSGKDIGMVAGFQLDQEDNEYAVVCLNAEYRTFGDILSGNDNVTVGKCWGYTSVMEITETGTEETQNIIEFINTNSSYTSSGATHARSKTFVIDGVTYQAQLPNFPEALKISSNMKRINKEDPSDSTYSSQLLPIATTTSTASEQMYASFGSATWYKENKEGVVASANNIYQIKPLGMSDASNRSQTANKLIVPILELPNYEVHPVVRRWNLLDRVTDDGGNEIGTVTSFFKADNGIEYTVVCLDAKDRALNLKLFSDASTQIQGIKTYQSTDKYSPFELNESATKINNAILTTATSTSKTSEAVNHCRSKSYTINGQVYYGQVPNVRELAEIYMVRSIVNSQDITTSSYSSYTLSGHNENLSCTQAKNGSNYKSYALSGSSQIVTKNNNEVKEAKDKIITPVLEIPNI